MTEIDKLKKEAIRLIESNKLRDCMTRMKEYLNENSSQRRVLSSLLRRYNDLLEQRRINTVETNTYNQGMNQIADILIDIVEQLNEENVSESLFIETVLIICRKNKLIEMKEFFNKKYFPNAEFINYGEEPPNGVYDVIVLEDMPTGSVTEMDMEKYLKETYPYFLYYGSGFFPKSLQEKHDKNKDRVYFTNSKFSLYSRLKELLDYIKYYGK